MSQVLNLTMRLIGWATVEVLCQKSEVVHLGVNIHKQSWIVYSHTNPLPQVTALAGYDLLILVKKKYFNLIDSPPESFSYGIGQNIKAW